MADPITTLATAVGFTVTTAKFLAQLHAVGGETGTVIDQIQIVMGDVIEAETLYQEQTPSLSEREQSRVQQIIKDTKKTLKQIATQVERARVSKVKHGTITLVHRLDWIFRKSGTAQSYQQILATCQRSLQGEIFKLRLKSLANGPRLPSYEEASSAKWIGNDTEFDEDLKDAINSFEHEELHNSDSTDNTDPADDSTPATIHPERVAYEAMQKQGTRKRKKAPATPHPERVLWEETQQRKKKSLNNS